MELHVRVLSGRNIPATDADKSDPYIKIFINGRQPSRQTRAIENSLLPEWNESFDFDVLAYGYDLLTLQLFDEDLLADDQIGTLSIKIALLPPGLVVHDWYPFAASPKYPNPGEVLLDLQVVRKGSPAWEPSPFQPLSLKLTVVAAKGLANMDAVGKSDPFAIVQLQHSPASFKTKTKDNTLEPVWNESTTFQMTTAETDVLLVDVIDEDVRVNDDLAATAIQLAQFADGVVRDTWFPLTAAPGSPAGGTIRLKIQIVPSPPFTPAEKCPGNLGAIRIKTQ